MDIERINRKVFVELGREKRLIQYHAIIFKLLGVVIDFINSEGESLKLSKMKNFNPYCAGMRSTESGFAACADCDRQHARQASSKHDVVIYRCHAGLSELVVPLFSESGTYVGGMTSGQFFLEDEDCMTDQEVSEVARKHHLDPERMCRLYRQTKILSAIQIEGIIEYLHSIGQIIIETHNKLLFMESIDAPAKIPLIKQFVKDNYMKKITLPDTARKFHLSSDYFGHYFKKEVGASFLYFVNLYRISQAEEMLLRTRNSISDIAMMTGFRSLSQFNRTFKTATGSSPREFRKKKSKPEILSSLKFDATVCRETRNSSS